MAPGRRPGPPAQTSIVRRKRPHRTSPDAEPLSQLSQRELSLIDKRQGRGPKKTPTRAKLKEGFRPTSGDESHINDSSLQIPPSMYGNNLDHCCPGKLSR